MSILKPLHASTTPIRASFKWITFPSAKAMKPKVCKRYVLTLVAIDCSGGPSAFSTRQGSGIMNTRKRIEGHAHLRVGQPPRSSVNPPR